MLRRKFHWRNGLRTVSGQVATEYLVVAGILLACVVLLSIFLYTFKEQGDRVLNIAASEYP
jgi:hypothetical protein